MLPIHVSRNILARVSTQEMVSFKTMTQKILKSPFKNGFELEMIS